MHNVLMINVRNASRQYNFLLNHTQCTKTEVQIRLKVVQVARQSQQEEAETYITRMWANAQPDGRPAEHRWRPLFNTAKFS